MHAAIEKGKLVESFDTIVYQCHIKDFQCHHCDHRQHSMSKINRKTPSDARQTGTVSYGEPRVPRGTHGQASRE